MRVQDLIVHNTQRALDDICRSALAVPADRRDWSPSPEMRSTLAQMREIATAGNWLRPFVVGDFVEDDAHTRASQASPADLATVEDCVEAARTAMADWCGLVAAFPDAELEREVTLPFGAGLRMTLADVLGMPAWNMTYHLGQINAIQLALGDKAMH